MKEYDGTFDPKNPNSFKIDGFNTSSFKDLANYKKSDFEKFDKYYNTLNDYIISIYEQYQKTGNSNDRYQMAKTIESLYDNLANSKEYIFANEAVRGNTKRFRDIGDGIDRKKADMVKKVVEDIKQNADKEYYNANLGDDWRNIYTKLDSENIDISNSHDPNKIKQYWDTLSHQILDAIKFCRDGNNSDYEKYQIFTAVKNLYYDFKESSQRGLLGKADDVDIMENFVGGKNEDIFKVLSNYTPNISYDSIINSKPIETPETPVELIETPTETPTPSEPTNNTTPIENPSQNQSSTVTDDSTKVDEWGKPVEDNVNTEELERQKAIDELNNGLRNGLSNISIAMGADGNPVINGRIGYTYNDTKLGIDELNNVVNERINEALTPFLQSSNFTTRQKINALETFFMNNPQYTNADFYDIVKFKNNLYNDINAIVSSNLSDDEKIMKMNDLANQYSSFVKELNSSGRFPFSFSDMWNDFQIDKDLTSRGLLKLAVDTTVDGQELSKALDMYLSNKSIYDDAIKNYENMVNSYTPDKLESLGQEYGDIESKYNAQKVDKQITNTATGLGQGGAIATQLGNEAQYQNYAENLADNQMAQTDNVTNYAQNKLDNEYAKVQNAYNNAMQAENAVMGEVDKNQADINAYLTKKGVDLATDKYNYERKMQPVQVATNVASSAANAVDKIKSKTGDK